MIRLSRRGWNNVLIIASLLMILLFNGVHHKLFQSDTDAGLNSNTSSDALVQNVLPEQSVVLSVDFPNISIERVGRDWRSLPTTSTSPAQLNTIVESWQQLTAAQVVNPVLIEQLMSNYPDKVVSFWLAGQKSAFVIQIYQHTDGLTYLKIPRLKTPSSTIANTWLTLPNDSLVSLIPQF